MLMHLCKNPGYKISQQCTWWKPSCTILTNMINLKVTFTNYFGNILKKGQNWGLLQKHVNHAKFPKSLSRDFSY